jgi:geranylgeranyl transferase type-2 subunit beta
MYLQELTVRLAEGLGRLPAEQRRSHADYLVSVQQPDGGFAGRMGGSDLYYTAFALRGLSILGELYGPVAQRAEQYLARQLVSHQTIVDFFSLFYAANLLKISAGMDLFKSVDPNWPEQVATFLETLRREDGGYSKAPEGNAGSTYHTFLVVLVLQLLERPIPKPEKVVEFLQSQLQPDGGWREIRVSKRAGTNPTAAAAATLRIIAQDHDGLGALPPEIKEITIDFLCDMQTEEGGLRANTRIPIADLLSSFTGGLTLSDLDSFEELDVDLFRRFVYSLQLPGGGFQAAAWDESHDVEYTFYGLGCLALLENH